MSDINITVSDYESLVELLKNAFARLEKQEELDKDEELVEAINLETRNELAYNPHHRPAGDEHGGEFAPDDEGGDGIKGDPAENVTPNSVDEDIVNEVHDTLQPAFPNANTFEVVGEPTGRYNCIAAAFDNADKPWWPEPEAGRSPYSPFYWPKDSQRSNDSDSFDALLIDKAGADVYPWDEEPPYQKGYQKLALFEQDGEPTHLARQLPNGEWLSKIGRNGLVVHSLENMEHAYYGDVAKFYRLKTSDWKKIKDM